MSTQAAKLFCALTMFAAIGVADRRADAQPPAGLNGDFSGTYRCGPSVTSLKLKLEVSSAGEVSGVFTFYVPSGTQQTAYAYRLFGQYDPRTAKFALLPTGWQTAPPANAGMMGMNGTFDSNELTGTITGPGCTTFQVERDRAEPARPAAAQVTAATPAPAAPSTPALTAGATTRAGQPPAARREAAPAAPRAAATQPRQAAAPSAAQRSVDDVVNQLERDAKEEAILHWDLGGLAGHQNDARRDVTNTQLVATAYLTDSDVGVDVTATCFENGIRMLFFLDSEGENAEFDWQVDPLADSDDDGVVDVPISVDGRKPHVAKGYPEESTSKPGSYYSDVMGFYFYDPGMHQRIYDRNLRGDTTFNILIDGAFGPLVKAKAQAAADSAVATAGGPISDLLSAKSVRVGLAVKDRGPYPSIDLEPQDAVFRRYVGDCGARLGGGH